MLKVVGASWLQTRISTYILVAVVLFGIGAIIIGEFGQVENDGTYSATVSWNHKGGYRIDFWGQNNDLSSVTLNVARAYYKTSILKSGWSIIEIETSSKYPDTVQAYAAGLLEGSLTWQLIHHHWHNTVNAVCEKRAEECQRLMQFLRENTAYIRGQVEHLGSKNSFWYMVRLFYAQLDGLEAGWKYAVRRSRQTVEIVSEHFLWLAMAANLPDLELALNESDPHADYTKGTIFLKSLTREGLVPLIAMGHTTAAPYAKMLRLLKKYTFGYHVLPNSKTVASVPGRSIVMSSYPGALSSPDEFYLVQGQNRELIIAGTPLTVTEQRDLWNFTKLKNQVISSVKVMAANRLATDSESWSLILKEDSSSSARQWVTLEPRNGVVLLIEQVSSKDIRVMDISQQFAATGTFCRIGKISACEVINDDDNYNEKDDDDDDDDDVRSKLVVRLQRNITTTEGYSREDTSTATVTQDEGRALQILTYRRDLEENDRAVPFGVIDLKLVLADADGVQSFEATSGPSALGSREPFRWSKSFPNVSHVGQPDVFDFDSISPVWMWI